MKKPQTQGMVKNNRPITKCCPFCELQVAVACKSCPGCKHSFYNAKRLLSQSLEEQLSLGMRRRTERVKREKPNYYDASEFERKRKKRNLERHTAAAAAAAVAAATVEVRERGRPSSVQGLKKKRKKKQLNTTLNNNKNNQIKDPEEEDICITVSSEKARQCSIILAELNRKFFSTTWKA